MRKTYQIVFFLILVICSVIYDFQKPELIEQVDQCLSYVILEGEFLQVGKYEFEGQKTIQDIVDEVGISTQANLNALSLESIIEDESRLYLPAIREHCVSLNQASQEELMTLSGIGEKTALKIIDYRQQQPFKQLEDIMNISGIGEKTYLKLREYLCL